MSAATGASETGYSRMRSDMVPEAPQSEASFSVAVPDWDVEGELGWERLDRIVAHMIADALQQEHMFVYYTNRGQDYRIDLMNLEHINMRSQTVRKIRQVMPPLQVTIVSARQLRNADFGSLSDPFVTCEVKGMPRQTFKTEMKKDTLDPVWNHTGLIIDYEEGRDLDFVVWDKDLVKSNDLLGRATLPGAKFLHTGFNGELILNDAKGHESYLTVKVEPWPPEKQVDTASMSLVVQTPTARNVRSPSKGGGPPQRASGKSTWIFIEGCGNPTFDGHYMSESVENGRYRYRKMDCVEDDGDEATCFFQDSEWRLGKHYEGCFYKCKSNDEGKSKVPPEVGWEVGPQGILPAPTIKRDKLAAAPVLKAHDNSLENDLPASATGQVQRVTFDGIEWGTIRSIDEDAYGAALVALIRDKTELAVRNEQGLMIPHTIYLRLAVSIGTLLTNMVFQFGMLLYIRRYIALPAIQEIQGLYQDFHSNYFDRHGNLLKEAWQVQSQHQKDQICEIALAYPIFYYIVISLWVLTMMCEVRDTQRLFYNVHGLMKVDEPSHMLAFQEGIAFHGECCILALTRGTRGFIYFICIAKLIIAFALMHLGLNWLTASDSCAGMILNALQLKFVVQIDEVLYRTLVPIMQQSQVKQTKFFFPDKQADHSDLVRQEYRGFLRTGAVIAVSFSVVLLYTTVFEEVIPSELTELRVLCIPSVEQRQVPLCSKINFLGKSRDCYPYGSTLI